MSDGNKEFAVVVGKLVIISIVAAVLLGITYVPTQAQLQKNQQEAMNLKLLEVMPDATFEPVYGDQVNAETGEKEIIYYRAKDASGNSIGYTFLSSETGAKGDIVVVGGVDSTFSTITGMSILSQEETPGLGSKIKEDAFVNQFNALPLSKLSLSSSGGSIDSITGATISSQAVVDALNSKVESIKSSEA
ncbi:electron transport complex, RnfABCDGE type, G subunit [Methanomethylovorans hollandica DSM 15978]|uniref:Ion-translocating oxidoreductase complex subunit G n=1 Tax=Methanomethylovorans hollandica (strain DSM 15978 / NBRC 107637 / DMS1) TaxID=867904 RepID=L0KX79_METHD|nr:Rnf electron transport complex subunit RnfG [Methanomethylovorans hollandica]AGB48683.1 electron transport complex, RnfABCDGE type, G subunit [Methanomethylovorans hollandica DSM 15978]